MGRKRKEQPQEEVKLEDIVEETETNDNSEVTYEISPSDPGWSDHVLTLFTEDELYEGNPRVHGLRRITQLLYGKATKSVAKIIETPNQENNQRAVVEYTVAFDEGVTYTDVADASPLNTDSNYLPYCISVASTRAEARALRKLLGVSRVAAEEVFDKDTKNVQYIESEPGKKIQDYQIKGIDRLCKLCDINVTKMLKQSSYGPFDKIEEVSYNIASKLLTSLNSFHQDLTKIPEPIKGYDQNWRNNND